MPGVPKILTTIFGSVYLLIILSIMLVLPILQLAFGVVYREQCSINFNIPIYLIVSGASAIFVIGLALSIGFITICFAAKAPDGASVALAIILGIFSVLIILMSFFLLAWFIVGNVWIFSIRNTVQHNDSTASNYCQRTLYDFAFWILIVQYILMGVSCCCNCFSSCCSQSKT